MLGGGLGRTVGLNKHKTFIQKTTVHVIVKPEARPKSEFLLM